MVVRSGQSARNEIGDTVEFYVHENATEAAEEWRGRGARIVSVYVCGVCVCVCVCCIVCMYVSDVSVHLGLFLD